MRGEKIFVQGRDAVCLNKSSRGRCRLDLEAHVGGRRKHKPGLAEVSASLDTLWEVYELGPVEWPITC